MTVLNKNESRGGWFVQVFGKIPVDKQKMMLYYNEALDARIKTKQKKFEKYFEKSSWQMKLAEL